MSVVHLVFDSGVISRDMDDVSEIVIDGCRFAPIYLAGLARASGELFCAERTGDTVLIHTISAELGNGGWGKLAVKRTDRGD